MTSIIKQIKQDLRKKVDKEKANFLPKFFKTGKGEYGEGDKFLGITVPDQREIAKKYYSEIDLKSLGSILNSEFHEERLTAIFILVLKFQKSKTNAEKKEIYDYYLKNTRFVNNWDIVDSSAHKIVGAYLADKSDRSILDKLSDSKDLWEQRIAIISTFAFIRQNEFNEAINLCKKYLTHKHDLIHKASGWVLREVGKKDITLLLDFLDKYYKEMPRVMLRYAIEKLSKKQKDYYMGRSK